MAEMLWAFFTSSLGSMQEAILEITSPLVGFFSRSRKAFRLGLSEGAQTFDMHDSFTATATPNASLRGKAFLLAQVTPSKQLSIAERDCGLSTGVEYGLLIPLSAIGLGLSRQYSP
eukprot:1082955-Amphidinium_carterae.1